MPSARRPVNIDLALPVIARIGLLPIVAISLALVVILSAVTAAFPSPALGATTLAARCDGTALRAKPSTTSTKIKSIAAGTQVVAVAKVSGSSWKSSCGSSTTSGSSWWRITSIGGKSVSSLYGRTYVYAATVLFKAVTTTTMVTACSSAPLRTSTSTTSTAKVRLASDTKVGVIGSISGSSWTSSCSGSSTSGSSWWVVTSVNGTSVNTLYGVRWLFAAKPVLKVPAAKATPTPTPTAKPTPTPTPTPAPTATPTPTPKGPIEGIDVSHWQGTISWTKVYAAGKRFAYIKASEDTSFVDPKYATNRTNAKAAGLKAGAYHFARPSTASGDAVAEADHFVDTATPKSGELLPVLDLETNGGLSTSQLTTWVKTFLERVYQRTGVRGAIYVSPGFWSGSMGNTQWFANNGYSVLWVAHWTSNASPTVPASNWGGKGWTFWQYSGSGHIDGITGQFDLDRYRYGDFTRVLIP